MKLNQEQVIQIADSMCLEVNLRMEETLVDCEKVWKITDRRNEQNRAILPRDFDLPLFMIMAEKVLVERGREYGHDDIQRGVKRLLGI